MDAVGFYIMLAIFGLAVLSFIGALYKVVRGVGEPVDDESDTDSRADEVSVVRRSSGGTKGAATGSSPKKRPTDDAPRISRTLRDEPHVSSEHAGRDEQDTIATESTESADLVERSGTGSVAQPADIEEFLATLPKSKADLYRIVRQRGIEWVREAHKGAATSDQSFIGNIKAVLMNPRTDLFARTTVARKGSNTWNVRVPLGGHMRNFIIKTS